MKLNNDWPNSSKGDYVDVRSTTLKDARQTILVVEWLSWFKNSKKEKQIQFRISLRQIVGLLLALLLALSASLSACHSDCLSIYPSLYLSLCLYFCLVGCLYSHTPVSPVSRLCLPDSSWNCSLFTTIAMGVFINIALIVLFQGLVHLRKVMNH